MARGAQPSSQGDTGSFLQQWRWVSSRLWEGKEAQIQDLWQKGNYESNTSAPAWEAEIPTFLLFQIQTICYHAFNYGQSFNSSVLSVSTPSVIKPCSFCTSLSYLPPVFPSCLERNSPHHYLSVFHILVCLFIWLSKKSDLSTLLPHNSLPSLLPEEVATTAYSGTVPSNNCEVLLPCGSQWSCSVPCDSLLPCSSLCRSWL